MAKAKKVTAANHLPGKNDGGFRVYSKQFNEAVDALNAEEVTSLILEGTTDSTSAQAKYGVNIASTSTVTDLACKLPLAETGRQVIIVNNSALPIFIFPSGLGGEINGVVDGSATVPPDGRAYSFFCTENPLPGAWVWSPPAIGQLVMNEMEIAHTNGVASGAYNDGIGSNAGSLSMGIGSGNLLLTGPWRTEFSPTIVSKIKCYSNVVYADLDTIFSPDGINTSLVQGYKSGPSSSTHGQKGSIGLFGPYAGNNVNVITGSTVNTPPEVGDTDTLWMEQVGLAGNANDQQIGTAGPYGPAYYSFLMSVPASAVTKTYKFKWFVEYYN